jgi:hypothetical protein
MLTTKKVSNYYGKVSSVEILNQLKPDQIENISIEKIDSVGEKHNIQNLSKLSMELSTLNKRICKKKRCKN